MSAVQLTDYIEKNRKQLDTILGAFAERANGSGLTERDIFDLFALGFATALYENGLLEVPKQEGGAK